MTALLAAVDSGQVAAVAVCGGRLSEFEAVASRCHRARVPFVAYGSVGFVGFAVFDIEQSSQSTATNPLQATDQSIEQTPIARILTGPIEQQRRVSKLLPPLAGERS